MGHDKEGGVVPQEVVYPVVELPGDVRHRVDEHLEVSQVLDVGPHVQ